MMVARVPRLVGEAVRNRAREHNVCVSEYIAWVLQEFDELPKHPSSAGSRQVSAQGTLDVVGGRSFPIERSVALVTRPPRAVGVVVRQAAADYGISISEYIAIVLAHLVGLPHLAPHDARGQEEIQLAG